ncbi:hypothetical protein OMR58_17650 [Erwinia sp. INIA-01]|uniref:hypothetical protein n=1 Tax=Erwinia sp. INIA01 TaxID=2991500 RepID=UPI002224D050|nr:hypothetical protein [Erwinia sp. INIA01]MCW1876279.1 hypothetical protein [Erwinia sp. INIA01]
MSRKRKKTGGNPAIHPPKAPLATPMRRYLRSGELGWNFLSGLLVYGIAMFTLIKHFSLWFLLPALLLIALYPFAKKAMDSLVIHLFSVRVCNFLNGSPRGLDAIYNILVIMPLTLPLALGWFIYCHRAARKMRQQESMQ